MRSGFSWRSKKLSIESRDILFPFFLFSEGESEIDGIKLLLVIACLEILPS